ncbi:MULTISPECIES: class I SAM-dependent methyltransferase [Streptomyces]|uniref:Class I SAM-dependent methyltransferase n=1 Tax=Streptomyces rhizosphaericola TaxID=2564098 RepID=A0ABY2PHY0_9ACTN|nr:MULTISPECIES: class I SAM-dependent methyltransferase [Streptomyces]ARI54898.1 methyltransferase [Streptomyces sp. S8]MYU00748.1 methyltransferase domain-containing protein [Streptomyces sp. SID8350]TGZ10685.1 class I SAM-dependent methyltransferase [Streptomyces rhizosphaericola]SCK10307.1 Methylase involved in ubiquinone/menaquinone biosynthesis [Streptomyces sp. AmelKG-D3]
MTTHSARARSFDAVAASYAANRPSYPPALFDAIQELSGRPLTGARVADVGAGTGIATALLAGRGARVTAVEPGDGMAGQLRRGLPEVPVVRGDGNRLPLRTGSLDLVTYAQSWHWTDPARSVPEARRVLRPGGALALWWNDADPRVGWIGDQKRRVLAAFGTEPGEGGEDVAAYDPDARLRAELPAGPDFRTRQVEWAREVPLGVHLANLASHSVFLVADRAVATAVLERERALLADAFPGGTVREAYVTSLGIART